MADASYDNVVVVADIETSRDMEEVTHAAVHGAADNNNGVKLSEETPATGMDECGPSSRRTVCGAASTSDSDSTADDAPLLENDHTAIDVDVHEVDKPASRHDRFPKERGKAVAAVGLLVFTAVLNEVVLSFVHERVPATAPLPDILFSAVPYWQKGLEVCEVIMIASFVSLLLLIFFHKHRWIVLRRLMLVGSLLYLMRCVTMMSTQVPVADTNFHCAPKLGVNATVWAIVLRGLKMVAGVGLNFEGQDVLCGDYIYSGHTIVLSLSALFIAEYSPRRWWPLHWFYWLSALAGMLLLVISRGHYTVDVVISYFICTRMFYIYHTMCAHPTLRLSIHNHHQKEFWFAAFRYMEGSVLKPVPRRFEMPISLSTLTLPRRVNSRLE